MATKKAAPKKATAPKQPVTYVEKVMFSPADVRGKKLASDNMDYTRPICVNNVEDGATVAVYQFVGLQKIQKQVTFTDVAAAK